jgi:hypothetical protein
MVYEAHWSKRFNFVLVGVMAAFSLLGFLVAGIIPSASTRDHGAYPLAGIAIILFCFAIAAIFLRRAVSGDVQARIDANGVYARAHNDRTIPWSEITGAHRAGRGNKSHVRFNLRDPVAYPSRNRLQRAVAGLDRKIGVGDFGINPNFYDHGMRDLVAALRHYRPDLLA